VIERTRFGMESKIIRNLNYLDRFWHVPI